MVDFESEPVDGEGGVVVGGVVEEGAAEGGAGGWWWVGGGVGDGFGGGDAVDVVFGFEAKENLESWMVHASNTGLSMDLMTLFRVQTLYRSSCTIQVCGEIPL